MNTKTHTFESSIDRLHGEYRKMMVEIDAELRLMKKPWAASSGEKRAAWQRMIDRRLDKRHELKALIESPTA